MKSDITVFFLLLLSSFLWLRAGAYDPATPHARPHAILKIPNSTARDWAQKQKKMVDSAMEDSINIAGQILEAVHFAALKHKDQRRKDPEKTPYINHPIGVAYILWKEGGINDTQVLQVSLWLSRTRRALLIVWARSIGALHIMT